MRSKYKNICLNENVTSLNTNMQDPNARKIVYIFLYDLKFLIMFRFSRYRGSKIYIYEMTYDNVKHFYKVYISKYIRHRQSNM